MRDTIFELKAKLIESVERNKAPGLLFSGGLDSAILATINPRVKAITISLEYYGEDIRYSNFLGQSLNIEHFHRCINVEEAIEAIPEVVKILKSFDPAIPNDLVVYFSLKIAKKLGISKVATGDGSDELFAGYNFMRKMSNLEDYIFRISEKMEFSSNEIGNFFDIDIKQPYIDKEIIEFALNIPVEFKVREENGKIWGKWILRKALEDMLPVQIAWQDKRALEYGSGMTRIREIIKSRVSDEEFKEVESSSSIKFISKEHYYYYRIYKDVYGEIPKPNGGEKECPNCSAGMDRTAFHCKVCGCILDWKTSKEKKQRR